MREIYIILHVLSTKKPKYVKEIFRQVHIFNSLVANPILQKAYIANILVNF